jgi:hypothetical protein
VWPGSETFGVFCAACLGRLFGLFADPVASVLYAGLGSLAMSGVLSRWLVLSALLAGVGGVAACGGGGSTGKSASVGDPHGGAAEASGPATDPNRVAARVGGSVITAGMLDRWMKSVVRTEPLVPPRFSACVARLQATGGTPGAAPATGAAKPSEAQLKASCEQSYQELRVLALDRYIAGDWVIGGARELGVAIGGQALQRRLAAIGNKHFHTQAAYESYLAKSGRTAADVTFLTETELDSDAIRSAFKQRVGPITPARVRDYYEQHKSAYLLVESRNLAIAAARTRAQASAVKRRVASGASFASVVRGLSWAQPVGSNEGLVTGLLSGYYKESALNEAIFRARPGVLTGPVKTVIGYYVFKVKKINHAVQKPLAAVAPSIKATLPAVLAQEALVNFIKRWRAKWTPRTDCSPEYVIPKCRQFKTSDAPPEDPYTLN